MTRRYRKVFEMIFMRDEHFAGMVIMQVRKHHIARLALSVCPKRRK